MRAIVALVALAAAAVVAGVVLATRQDPPQPKALCGKALSPIVVPGLSKHGAEVRRAFALGPERAARALQPLAAASPRDPVVLFNQATALYCAGYVPEASDAYRKAKQAGRDTFYEVKADNLLHPQFFRDGYPILQYYGTDPLLVQGQLQQRRYHQHSAEALYAKAARLHPGSADAQVAAAVGRFDMDNLSASFSRLGPLVKRFPRSQSVRFHLGYLLAWTGQRDLAVKEFRQARALDPGSRLGKDAEAFLRGIVTGGTNDSKR